MSYYGSQRGPSYCGSSPSPRAQQGYRSSAYGSQPPPGYSQDYGHESRGRSPLRRESRSDNRSVSPVGVSRFEQPFEMPHRRPSYSRGASRESLGQYEAPTYSRHEFSLDSRYDDVQARVGLSSFYTRDPYERRPPPSRGYSKRQEPPRRDPVSSSSSRRQSNGSYGVDISSMSGGYNVSGIYSSSGALRRRPSDGPDFSRGPGFAYGYDPGLDGPAPRQSSRRYPPSAVSNSYGGGTSGSLGGARRRPSRGYYQ
ncbi:hypothetical protein DOTSEDRAFT_20837 [Dothistroma septosporum NZE10]|uniref:Uncharacterized protein n=1 Tax=Dothistroma septosporum (strain NZE10 / CBS 128990) TaxID=675120 RepID=N1PUF5_DOTSN|nr:hypothetical protein DOTSEDRAFT_20837 [Dothistroma septosporum NZE10]